MSDLSSIEKEELTFEIEKTLTIKGVNTYASDLIPVIETFYKDRANLAIGVNDNGDQALLIASVNKGEADLVCLKCAEKMRYDALLDLYYCPICSTQIKQTCC